MLCVIWFHTGYFTVEVAVSLWNVGKELLIERNARDLWFPVERTCVADERVTEDSTCATHFDEGESGDTLAAVNIVFFIAVADFFEGHIFYFCLFLPLFSSVLPSVFARPAVLVMGADRKYCILSRTKCWRSLICSGIGMSYCQFSRSLNVSFARTDTVLIAFRCHQDCSPPVCD